MVAEDGRVEGGPCGLVGDRLHAELVFLGGTCPAEVGTEFRAEVKELLCILLVSFLLYCLSRRNFSPHLFLRLRHLPVVLLCLESLPESLDLEFLDLSPLNLVRRAL